MDRDGVLAAFRSAAVGVVGVDGSAVTEAASLADDLGAEPVDLVESCWSSRERLGVTVPGDAVSRIRTVADALDVLLAATPAAGGGDAADEGAGGAPPASSYWSATGYA